MKKSLIGVLKEIDVPQFPKETRNINGALITMSVP